MKTFEALTLILKLSKLRSSNSLIFNLALSNKALAVGLLYFSKIVFSKLPALTPILIGILFCLAASTTSFTLSLEPMLPGFIRKQCAPFSAASSALL